MFEEILKVLIDLQMEDVISSLKESTSDDNLLYRNIRQYLSAHDISSFLNILNKACLDESDMTINQILSKGGEKNV